MNYPVREIMGFKIASFNSGESALKFRQNNFPLKIFVSSKKTYGNSASFHVSNDAAEQDARLEIQRQAIESLQKAIICRDLVYYSLLIKTQAFFRGRIGDVRLIRSKMDSLAKSKQYLEDKCRRIKRLWREADRELRKIKCITSWELNCEQGSRDCATCTDALERCSNAETEARVNNLLRENEDLKRQLKSRRLEFDLFDEEVRGQLYNNNRTEGLADGSAGLRDSEDCPNINCMSSNDELNRRNTELDKLIDEAKDKQEELAMLQDMREQFETSENLERLNECLKKELFILRRRAEGDYSGRERGLDDLQPMHSEARQSVECKGGECARERERDSMKGLRDQLSSTRELTDECMAELRVSREMLSFLRGRICSLKKLLKEKSNEMAKLQADHQMIKNDYSILKTENGIFADKARAEIGEFREKLKALQAELRLVDGNYRRVSEDFDKSQKLLIEAARREVELQHGVTAMEQIFYSKLTSAEREGRRMSDLVDMLRSDLENAREELSAREENFAEKCRNAYDQMGTLEDRVALLEDSKLLLTRQLQECRLENCKLVAENTRLMENGCRCVQELEDTRNVLLELRGECKTKAQTLNSISAELNHVAASRSELCDESQLVVACIRAWIEEQRRLVENLSKKLKNEKNRIARYAFEKKALVATVKELTRVNGTLSEFSMRRKICQGHSPNRRYAKSNGYQTSASYNGSQKPVLTTSSTTVCTRPLKRRCVCLTRTSRRTLLRGNSWWFPKLEHVSKELCRKNRRRGEKLGEEYRGDETSMDETRDFGYQSSASK